MSSDNLSNLITLGRQSPRRGKKHKEYVEVNEGAPEANGFEFDNLHEH